MVRLCVTPADGRELIVEVEAGSSLMEGLRPLGIGIEGTCGGSMICGTCRVEVDPAWRDRLSPPSEGEVDTLDTSAVETGPHSRLSCQIMAGPALDGLRLAVPRPAAAGSPEVAGPAPPDAGRPPLEAAPDGPAAGAAEAKGRTSAAPSERARLKRYNWLAKYDRDTIDAIIDAGIVCQVGYVFDGKPYVTPTNHWRIDDHVYWHGSSASRMLKAQQKGIPVCFTVTHLDGIAFSRAAFNHNVLYRSVMAFGSAELCEEDVKREALRIFTDRLAPGLWDYARQPAEQEWKATKVIRMRLDEVSGKIADGLPDEDPEDLLSDRWAGYVPLSLRQAAPVADPKLRDGIAVPDFIRNFLFRGWDRGCPGSDAAGEGVRPKGRDADLR